MSGLWVALPFLLATQVRPDQLGHCANTQIIQFGATGRGACAALPVPGVAEWTDTGSILHPSEETVDEVVIGGTTEGTADIFLGVDGDTVINKQGNAVDFLVETPSFATAFLVDGSQSSIGMFDTPSAGVLCHIKPTASLAANEGVVLVGGTVTMTGSSASIFRVAPDILPGVGGLNPLIVNRSAWTIKPDGGVSRDVTTLQNWRVEGALGGTYTGTVTTTEQIVVKTPGAGGGTLTNAYGIAIEDINTATNNWALNIESQTSGKALVTGTGQIDFGGDIEITSDSILNIAAHDYLPRSSGSPTYATVDTASVQATAGAGSAVLFYSVAIPAQKHGELVNIRSITFYYALSGAGAQIDFNKWATHTADGTSAYFDNDTVAITAGTSHSVSGLSKTLASDETLWFKISIASPDTLDTTTLHGIAITYDTD